MRSLIFTSVFVVALVVGLAVSFYQIDDEEGVEVWDCTFDEEDVCVETVIQEHRYCQEEGDIPRQEYCRDTDTDIEEVTVFTDPSNYIKAPMTEEEYDIDSLDIGENAAWDADFLDDGSFFYTEMNGTLVRQEGDETVESASLNQTEKFGNTGLLGVAADPDFEDNRYVYLYYYTGEWRDVEPDPTEDIDPIYNRVSRFTFDDGELEDEKVLIDGIPGSSGHSGGRIDIGPDNRLYVTTGDSEYLKTDHDELHQDIQDRDFLGGKVLRTELDGSVPEENPFDQSYVYAEGFRNPQGISFEPETGQPFISEHGPWRYDRAIDVEKGQNYGWPAERCGYEYQEHVELEDETAETFYCFNEWTVAPSGTTFVDDPEHEWYGNFFITGLRGSVLYSIDVETGEGEVFYIRKDEELDNRLRNVEFHEGSLYLFGDGFGAGKLTPS